MTAFVGTDATETAGGLEAGDVLLDGLAGNAKCRGHADLSQMRLRAQEFRELLAGFLTPFLTTLF